MDIFIRVINLYFIFILGRFMLKLFILSKKGVTKNNEHSEHSKANSHYKNGWQEKVEKAKQEANMLEMVKDEVCGTYLQKEKAYQVIENNKTQYFCSWECRQNHIQAKNKTK